VGKFTAPTKTVLSNGKHQSPLEMPHVTNPLDAEHDIFCSDQLFSTGRRVPFVALDGRVVEP
jgi:hypothetical protein